jgi:hypothetical protein
MRSCNFAILTRKSTALRFWRFFVSESNVEAVTKYIATQEEHHKTHSFQEEFLVFLQKNNVAYDEKYLWG